jgi:hypothetical protein
MAITTEVGTGTFRTHPTLWVGISYVLTIVVVLAVVAKL